MTYSPYVSVADFRNNSLGIDLSLFPSPAADSVLNSTLVTASHLVDAETMTTWQYQTVQEMHPWDYPGSDGSGVTWQAFPSLPVIRTVTQFDIMVSVNGNDGTPVSVVVPVTPHQPSTTQPITHGQVFINRDDGFVQTVFFLLRFGLFAAYPSLAARPPQLLLTYTAGYDDGAQSDGASFPRPQWLVEGTRMAARYIVNEYNLAAEGMSSLESVNFGALEKTRSRKWDDDLPPIVRRMLRPHRFVSAR